MLHKTQTGIVELIDTYGHGKPANGNWANAPAVFTTDNGDGHYEAWRFTGRLEDAHNVVANFLVRDNTIIMRDGQGLRAIYPPHDFWADGWESGGPLEVSAKYARDCVAY